MHNINNQKIIIAIILAILGGFIFYHIYSKSEKETTIIENNLEIQNTKKEEEQTKEIILVHISGAVNTEGVVELEENSRISDAIEKARRSKRKCKYTRHKFSI